MSTSVMPDILEKLSVQPAQIWPEMASDQEYYRAVSLLVAELFETSAVVLHIPDGTPRWFEHNADSTAMGEPFLEASLGAYAGTTVDGELTIINDASGKWPFPAHSFPQSRQPIRFGAQVPLVASDGAVLGWLWILDSRPRHDFQEKEQRLLRDCATAIAGRNEAVRAFRYRDRLTGLRNRTQFVHDARSALKQASAVDVPVYAVVIDICSLEYVNHMVVALGLPMVERAIQLMSERLAAVLPSELRLYKLGHARFGFLYAGDIETVRALAAGCVARFEKPITVEDVLPVTVDAYAGIMLVEDEATASEVVSALFAASARARTSRKSLLVYDKSLMLAQQRCFAIINSARAALASGDQFGLVFQPRERLSDGACVAAEALLRWNHPLLGEISPGEFIPILEKTALMPMVTDWVIEHALRQLAIWAKTMPLFKLSINVSASDLNRPDLVATLARAMMRHGVSGANLEVEITESALARDVLHAREILEQLAELGVSVAIDDFGAGYSNLSQLYALPFNVLKIDNALVREVLTHQRADAVVQCVVTMAKQLGHRVVVEGVETEELRSTAARWNCDEAQGYFISRPMDASGMSTWLAERAEA